jgi:hypothetical protein
MLELVEAASTDKILNDCYLYFSDIRVHQAYGSLIDVPAQQKSAARL